MKKPLLLIALSLLLLAACTERKPFAGKAMTADDLYAQRDSVLADTANVSDTIRISYAKGLRVAYAVDGVHVFISNPNPSMGKVREEELVIDLRRARHNRFICTTALQAGNFEILGLEDRIVGINSFNNLFSTRIIDQLNSGRTTRIGKEGTFDLESIIAMQPEYIFVSASKHGGFDVLKDCGIPLLSHHGYKETDPLGQAEWIKLIGLLTGEPRRANAVFNNIELKYNTLKAEVAKEVQQLAQQGDEQLSDNTPDSLSPTIHRLPTVMSGRQIRDGWYVVGGQSYMAQIFRDAGADYVMVYNDESGGVTLDFEVAYAKGIDADFWQTDGTFDGDFTLADLAAEDPRYADLAAFKNKKVLFCNFSRVPYRELSPVEPHILLADFVKAFHPNLLPNYKSKYYKLIE